MDLLYERYKPYVYRFAFMLTRSHSDAEDVTQDVFLSAISCKPKDVNIKSWLLTAARNRALNLIRQSKHTVPISDDFDAPAPENPEASRLEMLDSLKCLSDGQQQIVVFRVIYGFSHSEIAEIMGLTPVAVRKQYSRAAAELRRKEWY
ncbi:hypothetical protein FACS1894208_11080 [Clostridia bacterium]|nr:hypothetical protein FACS1894208_11080 [Clostridia bacterium]